MMSGQPILILKEGTRRETGRNAQFNNIAAAKAVAEAVRSTLGPRGMDKMLVDSLGDVVITNDGVTILKEIDVEHPAAKMLVEVAKTQESECGDGTTTAVVLAGELLKKAEELLSQDVHPTVITGGYRMAAEKTHNLLEKMAEKVDIKDKDMLKKIAKTAMISKNVADAREHLAEIAVEAVITVAEKGPQGYEVDKDSIQIVKKQGGGIEDTMLVNGIIIDKERVHPGMPLRVKNPKIALIDGSLEVRKTEVNANIQIKDPSQLQAFLDEEEKMLRKMVDDIKKVGANVVFCQKGIDDMAQHFLSKAGIFAIRRVKKSDMEKLAKATGATVVNKPADLTKNDLGSAGLVEEKKVGNDDMTFITGCKNPKAVSILIRGGTEHVVDEAERSMDDAISVVAGALRDGKIVPGGGATAVELALKLREYAASVGGREQLAIEAFADALEIVPRTLAENAGLDPIDTVISLRKAHKDGKKAAGIDVETGKPVDMVKRGVVEPYSVGRQAIASATDAAVMVLRIDDVIAAKGTESKGKGSEGGGFDED
ncbi:MAG: TCP-1/cpn60 chaperonin family protein [Thermoplasmata archaeon]|nr:TCP-1/cpn60 chaperonin family protein [Thermoplasmata archaeon]